MAFIEVKNKKGTGGKKPPQGYTSWLDFWEQKKDKKATVCEATSCTKVAKAGGHVFKVGQPAKEYILPLCDDHNHPSREEAFKALEEDLVQVKD